MYLSSAVTTALKVCLEPGVDWEQGFCEGLVSAQAFVPLLSRHAINHPDKPWQNFGQLGADSKCDNVFLEVHVVTRRARPAFPFASLSHRSPHRPPHRCCRYHWTGTCHYQHRLAVELQGLGLVEKVFPIFIGDQDAATGQYGNYFSAGCHPRLPDVAVAAVEDKLRHHMETQV